MIKKVIILSLLFFCLYGKLYAEEYTKEKICQAIWIIEGKEKANQFYGINPKYVKCNSKKECYQICLTTVQNNFKRFNNQTKEKDYLTFLAKRYCPDNWEIWLKSLKYYLKKDN